jgi:hypothetical protein
MGSPEQQAGYKLHPARILCCWSSSHGAEETYIITDRVHVMNMVVPQAEQARGVKLACHTFVIEVFATIDVCMHELQFKAWVPFCRCPFCQPV